MTYDFKSFREFSQHNAELNHLKHRLKSPMTSDDRTSLEGQIADKTKTVLHHLNKLHQGKLQEDGVGGGAMGGSPGPTNVVGSGAIAGTGGAGGEPGVHMKKKKASPVIMKLVKRKLPQ